MSPRLLSVIMVLFGTEYNSQTGIAVGSREAATGNPLEGRNSAGRNGAWHGAIKTRCSMGIPFIPFLFRIHVEKVLAIAPSPTGEGG